MKFNAPEKIRENGKQQLCTCMEKFILTDLNVGCKLSCHVNRLLSKIQLEGLAFIRGFN